MAQENPPREREKVEQWERESKKQGAAQKSQDLKETKKYQIKAKK